MFPSRDELRETFWIKVDGTIMRHVDSESNRWGIDNYEVKIRDNTGKGYCRVYFKGKMLYVHHVVWVLEGNKMKDGWIIRHKDGNRLNNRVRNLEQVKMEVKMEVKREEKEVKVVEEVKKEKTIDWQSIDIEDLSQELPKLDMPW